MSENDFSTADCRTGIHLMLHLLIDLQDIPDPQPLRPGQHYKALSHAMRLLKG